MGAEQFYNISSGKDMEDAFRKCVDSALYDYGHAGYTGTIAEKGNYINLGKVSFSPGKIVQAFESYPIYYNVTKEDMSSWERDTEEKLATLVKSYIKFYNDKWGPALGFEVEEDKFLFIGWASS